MPNFQICVRDCCSADSDNRLRPHCSGSRASFHNRDCFLAIVWNTCSDPQRSPRLLAATRDFLLFLRQAFPPRHCPPRTLTLVGGDTSPEIPQPAISPPLLAHTSTSGYRGLRLRLSGQYAFHQSSFNSPPFGFLPIKC